MYCVSCRIGNTVELCPEMRVVSFLVLLFINASWAHAQQSYLERSRLNQAAFYNYAEPGDVTVKVHVWGAVRFAGLYEIPRGTTVTEVVSLAGGPQFGERNRRTSRSINITLLRRGDHDVEVAYQSTMKNQLLVVGDDPILVNGDVLTFDSTIRQGLQWRDVFPVVSMVGTIILIAERLRTTP